MSKAENVIKYYVLCNKLKDIVRTGWKNWKVKRDRVESVAEHIYGAQMLAIAMKSEYEYDVDITKVIYMLAIHELEEAIIGDLTQFQITKEEKKIIGHKAVNDILDNLLDKEEIFKIIVEFDERNTKEALFAHYCDKLECDIQSRLYDLEGSVDLNNQEGNESRNNELVKELLDSGMSFSEMWLTFGQRKYNYDDNFLEVSEYAKNNKIKDLKQY